MQIRDTAKWKNLRSQQGSVRSNSNHVGLWLEHKTERNGNTSKSLPYRLMPDTKVSCSLPVCVIQPLHRLTTRVLTWGIWISLWGFHLKDLRCSSWVESGGLFWRRGLRRWENFDKEGRGKKMEKKPPSRSDSASGVGALGRDTAWAAATLQG